MRQSWPPPSKSGFSETSYRVYPRQVYSFVANLSIDADDSINFHEFVNQPIGHSKLFIKLCIPPLKHGHLKTVGLKNSRPAPLGNDGPAEKRKPHEHTISGRGKKPWPPPLRLLLTSSPQTELTDHMQKIVSQNPHLQAGLIGLKPLATGTCPNAGCSCPL